MAQYGCFTHDGYVDKAVAALVAGGLVTRNKHVQEQWWSTPVSFGGVANSGYPSRGRERGGVYSFSLAVEYREACCIFLDLRGATLVKAYLLRCVHLDDGVPLALEERGIYFLIPYLKHEL